MFAPNSAFRTRLYAKNLLSVKSNMANGRHLGFSNYLKHRAPCGVPAWLGRRFFRPYEQMRVLMNGVARYYVRGGSKTGHCILNTSMHSSIQLIIVKSINYLFKSDSKSHQTRNNKIQNQKQPALTRVQRPIHVCNVFCASWPWPLTSNKCVSRTHRGTFLCPFYVKFCELSTSVLEISCGKKTGRRQKLRWKLYLSTAVAVGKEKRQT